MQPTRLRHCRRLERCVTGEDWSACILGGDANEAVGKARTMKSKNRIAEWRRAAGLTQVKLAELLGTTGNSISRLEKGRTRLSVEMMEKIASALGRELSDESRGAAAGLQMAIEIVKAAPAP